MRFHVVALPNSRTTKAISWCAFQSKVLKFCKMMTDAGHVVFHYGVEGSDPVCHEHVTILPHAMWKQYFGQHDPAKSYSPIEFDVSKPYWAVSNANAAKEIRKRAERDFVCLVGGRAQQPIQEALKDVPNVLCVEPFVGYYGVFTGFRAFESYAHMHTVYGQQSMDPDGKNFDAVVPNYWDLDEFTVSTKPQGYCLFMGRLVNRKGLDIAVETTRLVGVKLLICGQGVSRYQVANILTGEPPTIYTEDGGVYSGWHLEYAGVADAKKRDELMGGAMALLAPSKYTEPFCGVAVECQLTGTPAIVPDFGAPTETVMHGVTGYRCRTLEQYVWAIKNAHTLNRATISRIARSRYSLQRVAKMYEEWFGMLSTLWGDGWYANPPRPRKDLDWLTTPA